MWVFYTHSNTGRERLSYVFPPVSLELEEEHGRACLSEKPLFYARRIYSIDRAFLPGQIDLFDVTFVHHEAVNIRLWLVLAE